MTHIVVINESTVIGDNDIREMRNAFEHQWNYDLRPVWGVDQARFLFVPKGYKPYQGSWWLVFLDDSDQAGALAYHDLTNDGLPMSKVFVKTLLEDKASISVGATHELCEMAVDPWLNSAYQDMRGVFWAGEVCDPVESDEYGYKIGDVLVSDFITPAWYAHEHSSGPVDFKGHASKAFQVLSGGYAQEFDPQQGWIQVNGDKAKLSHQAHAPIGSRRERRRRQWKNWQRSQSARGA